MKENVCRNYQKFSNVQNLSLTCPLPNGKIVSVKVLEKAFISPILYHL